MSENGDKIIVRQRDLGSQVGSNDPIELTTKEAQGHINYRTGIGYRLITALEKLGGKPYAPFGALVAALGGLYFFSSYDVGS